MLAGMLAGMLAALRFERDPQGFRCFGLSEGQVSSSKAWSEESPRCSGPRRESQARRLLGSRASGCGSSRPRLDALPSVGGASYICTETSHAPNTERHRETQTQRDTERHRETQRETERCRGEGARISGGTACLTLLV